MKYTELATNEKQRNRLLGVLALIFSLMVICGLVGYTWNEPAMASKGVFLNLTISPVPTDEGGIIGVIAGGNTPTMTPVPPDTAVPSSTPTPVKTSTPVNTSTRTPTPKPTNTTAPTATPNATGFAKTATAAVKKTATAIAKKTSTAAAKTATAKANGTATSVAKTATAGAPTLVPSAQTATAAAKKTATAVANATATAVAQTATAVANATATAVAQTATAGAPTQTPVPTYTPLPTPTPVLLPTNTPAANQFDYTCLVGSNDGSENACGDGYYGVRYEFRGGTWFPISTYCMSTAQCQQPVGPALDEYSYLPCVPKLAPNGILLQCKPSGVIQTWNVRAEVNTACPINEVLRAPYPRAMVNVDTNFLLQQSVYNSENGIESSPQSPFNINDFIDSDGNPNAAGYDAGVWRDLYLVMRSQRFQGGEDWFGMTAPKPQWIFMDRDWNAVSAKYASLQAGPAAVYNYQTSSAGMPITLGRAFDPFTKIPAENYTLPAYNVIVKTYCGHEWKVKVKTAERFWNKEGACYETKLYPDGSTYVPPGTSNDGCQAGYVAAGNYVYQWQDQETDWAGIDLRDMGRTTSYDVRTKTKSGGIFSSAQYWDTPEGIWVPVIEVQSVLRDKCVQDGSCEPPVAEPDSINP